MKKIAKMLKFIATGSMALLLSACYGVAYQIEQRSIRVKVKARTTSDEPIPGLAVSWGVGSKPSHWIPAGKTDTTGMALVACDTNIEDTVKIKIEDIDGDTNGVYVAKTIIADDTVKVVTMDQL